MRIKNIINFLEKIAPKEYAENFDNVGLLIGSDKEKITSVIITLDITKKIIEESIKYKCNLIITFHPFLFKKIKKITNDSYIGSLIIQAIKNNISIYCIHTNLDNIWNEKNHNIAKNLNLKNVRILIPKHKSIRKITIFLPKKYLSTIKTALFKIGCDNIENYNNFSYFFNVKKIKEKKSFSKKEICLNIIFPSYKTNIIQKTILEKISAKKIRYEIFNLININKNVGLGIIGNLKKDMSEKDFLIFLKKKLIIKYIRHSSFIKKNIKKIAIVNGSGSFALPFAKSEKADILISSDFKYHDFFKAYGKLLIVDIGHYESEKFIKIFLKTILKKEFPNLIVLSSKINTNPINIF